MKRKALKISLGVGGVAGILAANIAVPLISCSNATDNDITVDRYPQSFNDIPIDEYIKCINQGPKFDDPDYQQKTKFIFDGIKSVLNDNQKSFINTNEINDKNYIKSMGYSDDNKYLIIKTISNGKTYTFSFLRSRGDLKYQGENQASIPGFDKNSWVDLLNYNDSQFSQKYINNFYKELGINININNGSWKPWLTNGYYDGVNRRAVFTLYGYHDEKPFINYDSDSVTKICIVGFSNKDKGCEILWQNDLYKINNNDSTTSNKSPVNIENTKLGLWKNKNDVLNIVHVLNAFTNISFDATNNLLGNEQQLVNGIETNISRLLQMIGNVTLVGTNPNTNPNNTPANLAETLINILRTPNPKAYAVQIKDILKNIVDFCKKDNTYTIYNQILNSINHFLELDTFNYFVDVVKLNKSFEDTIIKKDVDKTNNNEQPKVTNNNQNPNDTNVTKPPFLLSNDFLGLVKMFEMFDIWSNAKNDALESTLWTDFVKNEFTGWGLHTASQIANNWLMIASLENIYFESKIFPEKDIHGNTTNKITGKLYLKIVNNTNAEQELEFLGQKYIVKVDQAFNFYLNINDCDLVPYVYQENNQYKLGLNILGDQNSYYQVGVFDKNAKNILENTADNSSFVKKTLEFEGIKLNNLTACAGNVQNVQVQKPSTPNESSDNSAIPNKDDVKTRIEEHFKSKFVEWFNVIKSLKTITSEFSKNDNTILQALSNSAKSINVLLVDIIKGLANFGQDRVASFTNLASIVLSLIAPQQTNKEPTTPSVLANNQNQLANINKVLMTINNILPYLNNIINYVPHYDVTLSNGKTIDLLGGKLENGEQKQKNEKTVLEMFGNLIEGLLTSYQFDTNNSSSNQKPEPYPVWDFAYDHINDLVGILVSITPIKNMIPEGITDGKIINSSQWQPIFPNNQKSSLDSVIPIIVTNFYNLNSDNLRKSKAEIKDIVSNLDGMAHAIEGLLSNGGMTPPNTLAAITNLIIGLSATAGPNSQGESLLSYISSNGQNIVNLLKGINPNLGSILEAILTTFTNKDGMSDGFLNVTIGSLNNVSANGGSADNNGNKETNFWNRLEAKLKDKVSPTIINVVHTIGTIAPIINKLLTIVSNPLNENGSPIDENGNPIELTSDDVIVNLVKRNNQQKVEVSFKKTICFDVTEVIKKINTLLHIDLIVPIISGVNSFIGGSSVSNPFKPNNGEKYFIKFDKQNPIIYDLNGVNPSYSNIGNNLLINGLSAHLSNESKIGNILGFIDFTELNNLIAQTIYIINNIDSIINKILEIPIYGSIIKKWIKEKIDAIQNKYPNIDIQKILENIKTFLFKIKPILNIVIDILSLNKYDSSSLGYFIINLLLPNFGSLKNLAINKGNSKLQFNSNEIDPFNYIVFDDINNKGKVISDLNISELTTAKIVNTLMQDKDTFGNSFWSNISYNKASFDIDKDNNFIYKTAVPLIGIDKQGNRRQINSVKFTFSGDPGKYKLTLTPFFSDSNLTTNIRNLVYSLLSSNIITLDSNNNNNNVKLSGFGESVVNLLDKYINSPEFNTTTNNNTVIKTEQEKIAKDFDFTWSTDTQTVQSNFKIDVKKTNNFLKLKDNKSITLEELVNCMQDKNTGWAPTNNSKNQFDKLVEYSTKEYKSYKIVKIDELKKEGLIVTQWYQTITIETPNWINSIFDSPLRFEIRVNFGSKAPSNPIEITTNNSNTENKPDSNNSVCSNSPIAAANNLLSTLYQIAIDPNGILIEWKFGTIIDNIYTFVRNLLGYYPALDKLDNFLNKKITIKGQPTTIKEYLINLINDAVPQIIVNANNENCWLTIQTILNIVLKFINK